MEGLNVLVRKLYKHCIAVVSGYTIPKLKLQEWNGTSYFKKIATHQNLKLSYSFQKIK